MAHGRQVAGVNYFFLRQIQLSPVSQGSNSRLCCTSQHGPLPISGSVARPKLLQEVSRRKEVARLETL
jgi:hypothetical protein